MSHKMYREELMEYFKSKTYRGIIDNPDFQAQEGNPSCGDKLHVTGTVSGDTISDIKFEGSGCVISVATAFMLAEQLHSKKIQEALAFSSDDLVDQIGITLGPTRMRCLLLSLSVLHNALNPLKIS